MNFRRVSVLLGKEFVRGPRNFLFIFAIVIPIIITLIITLLFGTLFLGKPKLGIVDQSAAAAKSQFVQKVSSLDSVIVKEYDSDAILKDAVRAGAVDIGMIVPRDFDSRVLNNEETLISVYVWGQSLLKDRAVLASAIAVQIREMVGQESPVEIVEQTIGDGENVPWEERLLPFVVLMTILIGGTMVPAASLVDEKQSRTITALTITPTSLGELFVAKGLLGIILSVGMGVLILLMNRAFGSQPLLLIVVLGLGAVMAATFGVLLGVLVKDINTLFATIKGLGLLLYAPAIVYLFPAIPAWVGRLFPTYYMIQPVVEITQEGAGWGEVAPELLILTALIGALVAVVAFASNRIQQKAA